MSRAFVKEGDGGDLDAALDLPVGAEPNYVTPRGLEQLRSRLTRAEEEVRDRDAAGERLAESPALQAAERQRRYCARRLATAVVVTPAPDPKAVSFGTTVEVEDESGRWSVRIVGEDEADAAAGLVSWHSPLARALHGAAVGDVVVWTRPAGERELEVLAIRVEPAVQASSDGSQ